MSISKLVIKAYGDEKFNTEKGEFSASINPANLKITSSIEYEQSQGMGSPSMALRYNVSPPRKLSFKLLFDNTGIFPDSDKSVKEQLEDLQKLIYSFRDEINAPYYVRVIWGVIDFKGKLITLETSYTMFQADGAPIRAEVDIEILEEADATGLSKAMKAAQDEAAASNLTTLAAGAGIGAAVGAAGGATAASVISSTNEAPSGATSNATPTAASTNAGTDSELNDTTTEGSTKPGSQDSAGSKAGKGATAGSDDPANPNNKSTAAGQNAGDNKQPNGTNNAATGLANKDNSKLVQTGASDKLSGISKNALGDANLAKKLGSLNGLDSLRNLASGLSLAVPLTLAGLLAMLLAMGKKYGSKGAGYLKQKAKSGKEKAKSTAKSGKEKAVTAKDKVKSKL
jgi:hypothetical protein